MYDRILAPIGRRISNLVSRAVVRSVRDSDKLQSLQLGILEGETRDDIEHFQNYGFSSSAPVGSEAVVLFPGGRRDHGLAIAVEDRRVRFCSLESGEAIMYNNQGCMIRLKANGDIEITPGSGSIKLNGSSGSVAKGEDLNSAIQTYGQALTTALTTFIGAATVPSGGEALAAGVLTTAVTAATSAFSASATAALSTKVKLA